MTAEELRQYCLTKTGVTEGFPFDTETLVFKVGGKIFLLMSLEHQPLRFNVKCDPEYALELREHYHQITPGYHMNKKHWNTVEVDGLKAELIKKLIDDSYNLIFNALPAKIKAEIAPNKRKNID